MAKIYLQTIAIWLLCIGIASSQPSGEPSAEAYLHLPVGTRAVGMHGAFTAVANDPAALWFNPSSFAFFPQAPQFHFTSSIMSFRRLLTSVSYAQQFFSSFGGGIGILHNRAGSITARTANGQFLGEYANQQFAIQAAVAYQFHAFAFGIAGKYLLNLLNGLDIRADGYGLDASALLRYNLFSIGLAVKNIGATMIWNNANRDRESIPLSIHLGAAVEFPWSITYKRVRTILGEQQLKVHRSPQYVLLSMEAQWIAEEKHSQILFGMEIAPLAELQLRGGIPIVQATAERLRSFVFSDFTLGISLKPALDTPLFGLQIDYAVSQDYLTVSSRYNHHLGITLIWW